MGKYTAQVRGGFFAQYGGTLTSMDPLLVNSKDHRRLAQELSHKKNLEFRAIVDTLVLSGVGGTAVATWPEIAASQELGGLRPVVLTTIINRVMTGNDIADVRETVTSLSSDTYTPNPVFNGDRNPLGTR